MSQLEEATPHVAAMIGRQEVALPIPRLREIAEWAVAAAIVRSSVDLQVVPIDQALAKSYRQAGLSDLPLTVGIASYERTQGHPHIDTVSTSVIRDGDNIVTGHLVIFWLDRVAIVVATEDWSGVTKRGVQLLNRAVVQAWPASEDRSWPPPSTVSVTNLLSGFGIPAEVFPRAAFDHSNQPRGRQTVNAFVLRDGVTVSPTLRGLAEEAASQAIARQVRGS